MKDIVGKKICMITTGHSALDDRIFYKEAYSLRNAGYEVSVIAPKNQNGFILDMGKKQVARDKAVINGIAIKGFQVNRPALSTLPKVSLAARWIDMITLGLLKIENEKYAKIIEKGIEIEADAYHCHELDSLYVGLKIKKELSKKGKQTLLVSDIHEYWPAMYSDSKIKNRLWRLFLSRFEKRASKYVDCYITVNPVIRGHILFATGYRRTEVLYNCPGFDIFKDDSGSRNDDAITICHEGFMTYDRGLKEMLEVMNILKMRYGSRVKLLIIGDVCKAEKQYLEDKMKVYGLGNLVECSGWVDYENVGNWISRTHIGIIFMGLHSENNILSSPNKLFNYMRYGLPVVTVDHPELRRIVIEEQCGIVARSRSADSLAEAISLLVDDTGLRKRLGENGRKAIMEKYNWGIMEKKLLRIYDEIFSDNNYVF